MKEIDTVDTLQAEAPTHTRDRMTRGPSLRTAVVQDPRPRTAVTRDPSLRTAVVQDPSTRTAVTRDPSTRIAVSQDPNTRTAVTRPSAPRGANTRGANTRGADTRASGPPFALTRRTFMQTAGLVVAAAPLAATLVTAHAARAVAGTGTDTGEGVTFADGPRQLVRYPGKRPLIRVTARPPHLETPFSVFNEGPITANDAFFVRYHLANIPLSIDPATYRLAVKGLVNSPLSLSLAELKSLAEPTEVIAVNQCSGNSRGFSAPRVFGAQLANGAMGNARWVGVPLRKVLERAGVGAGARQVTFNGLDAPILPSTPDFRKALDIEHALSGEPLLAWSMNGKDIPFLNGYPLKLIVPGYFGTYWVKHLSEIEVIDHTFEGHDAAFMTTAYRVPDNDCQCVAPRTPAAKTRPISTLPVRSFITNTVTGAVLPARRSVELRGIAFDSGKGIRTVEVSTDQGQNWRAGMLGKELGRYSFREWRSSVSFDQRGPAVLMVRATNTAGETQPAAAEWNPAGYRRHVIESTSVTIA